MRNRYVLLADLAGVGIAAFGAFALRFDWHFLGQRPEFLPFVCAALIAKPVVYYAFGLYRRYWPYASARDLVLVVMAAATASATLSIMMGVAVADGWFAGFSRSVLLIDCVLSLLAAGGIRLSVRILGEARIGQARRPPNASMRRVLVVGAGNAGAMVVREMQRNPQLGTKPIGFLDDDAVKRGKRIYGVAVLAATHDLPEMVRAYTVDEVVIAMPTSPGHVLRRIVESCQAAGVTSRTIPGVYELIDGLVSVSRLRQVEIADLLRREQITMPQDATGYLAGRVVLVTGAGGSIGLELCRQIAHAGPERLVLLGHGESTIFDAAAQLQHAFPGVRLTSVIADVRDRDRLDRVFRACRPAIVLHAAAHKHVPLMEENVEEAITNNVVGTSYVVEAALAAQVERLVLISTDKAVAPSSLMGVSKRIAEIVVRDAARRSGRPFVVVRFGNVLGSRGSVVPILKQQIERGGPLTLTHPDMTRFFMTIPEAVHLVLRAGGMGQGGELFVLNMGQPMRIVDLATDLIRLSGLTPDDIPIVFTGMRPGEKLAEQLWETGSLVAPTPHPEVLCITEPELDPRPAVADLVASLAAAATGGRRPELDALLTMCVPTFHPHIQPAAGAGGDLTWISRPAPTAS